ASERRKDGRRQPARESERERKRERERERVRERERERLADIPRERVSLCQLFPPSVLLFHSFLPLLSLILSFFLSFFCFCYPSLLLLASHPLSPLLSPSLCLSLSL